MRRVVVTGLGLVTPLGGDVETTWANILAAKSGAGTITRFDASDQKCRIACEVKPADHEYGFDPNKRVDHKVQRQVDPFIIYGIDAAGQAIEDAGPARNGRSDAVSRRLLDRVGHRRPSGHRERIAWCWPKRARAGSARTSSTAG